MEEPIRAGILRDELFLEHDSPFGYHPERSERLTAVWEGLDAIPALAGARVFPARAATLEELGRAHDGGFVRTVLRALERPAGFLDPDTYFGPGTRAAALGAAGGGLDAARAAVRGEVDLALATVRPPGHHAGRGKSMGFCVFNNLAVAAAGLLADGVERVLVVDFDGHHGNGTQQIFESDRRVLFISMHLWPHYPGSGISGEIGGGEGRGFTANVPLPHRAGNAEYREVFDRLIDPLADAFRPEALLVSAGYDSHEADPLVGLGLDDDGFREMGARLRRIARRHTGGRLTEFLEGGYDLDALKSAVRSHVEGLLAGEGTAADPVRAEPDARATAALERTLEALRPCWPEL
jgi:acetoin utilization deacetylase AcuC-like enzyme